MALTLLISLSELLYLPLPPLPTMSQKSDSILIGVNSTSVPGEADENIIMSGGKWEDEEERRFFEDLQDLKDFVPKSILGIEEGHEGQKGDEEEKQKLEAAKMLEEVRKLEEELEKLGTSDKPVEHFTEHGEEGDVTDGEDG
jgi:regulator of nonsense transcripts 2